MNVYDELREKLDKLIEQTKAPTVSGPADQVSAYQRLVAYDSEGKLQIAIGKSWSGGNPEVEYRWESGYKTLYKARSLVELVRMADEANREKQKDTLEDLAGASIERMLDDVPDGYHRGPENTLVAQDGTVLRAIS